MAGYSETPLWKKLGLKEGQRIKIINAPAHYERLIGGLMQQLSVESSSNGELDFIHFFTNDLAELESSLPLFRRQIKSSGGIWVSWYKKSAGLPTGLSENLIRDRALAAGLVDVKVCAVDEQWSGLKLMIRLADRQCRP